VMYLPRLEQPPAAVAMAQPQLNGQAVPLLLQLAQRLIALGMSLGCR